ncbi:endonuclease domain-containing protein [Lysobacter sp. KIS68-7]|uniref:UDP-N-acetyl-alpha-D-muramoyl-L-alanyl-L- glutamate epimerase n=1 Tax=Lysobacter sp. KIS68-7 TaxID=2904252 RepID=UPI001E4CCBFB|nr:UDP-N-acetyl-alpha-D-muramoyl-L-alanyl-L-glutamate epimerase [Lysobacter sp. KIS68-7]UHQ19656.1 endonuclease domain-containing protein [Lysobacter sp. KIS68-7]
MSWTFSRDAIRAFRFVRCTFDATTGVARLVYAFDDGPELVETITLPGAPFVLDGQRAAAAERALRLLHLLAGVSYYKAAVPGEIRIEGAPIDAATAALLESFYLNGLGEFAYRNGMHLHGRIHFPHAATDEAPAPAIGLERHALVAIGGGKDSLVSIEALRTLGVSQTVTWIGGSQLIKACAERTGLPTLNIGRALAPELFEFNRQGAWNGHIPVTGVNSAIMLFAAIVLGHDQVVFSNERSASYGSLIPGTGEVNHQWSKGWAWEQALAAHVQSHVAADLYYYSLLRPLSELAVARQFAKSDRYDAHFSSCNRNFHLLGERPANRWCGVCPKCHFVFLALAPFMSKPRLVGIFGRNLLDDPAQIPGYDALLEFQDHKPFECVGEGRESRAALAALAERPEWREDALVERFVREIRPQLDSAELELAALLQIDDEHRIPPALWDSLRAHFAT